MIGVAQMMMAALHCEQEVGQLVLGVGPKGLATCSSDTCIHFPQETNTNIPSLVVVCCLVVKSCLTLCDLMDQSMSGPPVFHCLPEFDQIHVGSFDDTVQTSHPLSSPSLAFTLSQHQGLFQGVFSSHQLAKVLEPQLQDLSFQ